MPYSLARRLYPSAYRRMRLASRSLLAPGFVRLRLEAARQGELQGFTAPGSGDHVRVFVGPAEGGAVPVDDQGAPLGEARVETVVDYDAEAGWIDLDVLVHGEAGVIGPWAARAPLGAPAIVAGPKGSVVMSGLPEAFVLAGDDSAIPAIRRYLGMLGPNCRGTVLLETRHEPAALGIAHSAGVELRILVPDEARPSGALIDALLALPRPDGAVFVFACGEASVVAPARRLLAEWGIEVEQAVVKGYWKR